MVNLIIVHSNGNVNCGSFYIPVDHPILMKEKMLNLTSVNSLMTHYKYAAYHSGHGIGTS